MTTLRDQALGRLMEFVARSGRAYAATRNYDRGPSDRSNVSQLSPFLRRRIITESEVLAAVLAQYSLSAAQKFVSEVFWRTYWKGWLEAHPAAWLRYVTRRDEQIAELNVQTERHQAYENAVSGRTGIDAFDAWASELVETNYLHNHARMWFASIWIFTLELPWELGADFFLRHLLDGDPASNTLSWRWVAGLQTRGRTYAATRDNIRRYTGDRFLLASELRRSPAPLADAPIPSLPLPALEVQALAAQPTLLLLHDDDVVGDGALVPAGTCGVLGLGATSGLSPLPVHHDVVRFAEAALREAASATATLSRAADLGQCATIEPSAAVTAIVAAAAACNATRVVAPYAPIGPVRSLLDAVRPVLVERGLTYAQTGRRYDRTAWPAASRGFFALRERIPAIIAELGLGAG